MARIDVDTSSVSTAGGMVSRSATDLSNISAGRSLMQIGDYLPGSATAESAGNASRFFDRNREELQAKLSAFADDVANSATNYVSTETVNQQSMQFVGD